jgi:Ca2+/Na+ antiporter
MECVKYYCCYYYFLRYSYYQPLRQKEDLIDDLEKQDNKIGEEYIEEYKDDMSAYESKENTNEDDYDFIDDTLVFDSEKDFVEIDNIPKNCFVKSSKETEESRLSNLIFDCYIQPIEVIDYVKSFEKHIKSVKFYYGSIKDYDRYRIYYSSIDSLIFENMKNQFNNKLRYKYLPLSFSVILNTPKGDKILHFKNFRDYESVKTLTIQTILKGYEEK